jgi:hypothetical protein
VVLRNVLIASVVVVAGTVVHAQTPVAAQVPAQALHQVKVFEANLKAAIEKAADQLADRAKQVVPDIKLTFETPIRTYSAVMPNGEGILFFVEVPAIEGTSAKMWDLYRSMLESPRPNPNNPRMSNSTNPGLVPGMPIDPSWMTEPEKEYAEFTRQSLVDAMLDNAFALPLKEGQTLTLVVGVAGSPGPSAIGEPARKLYLSMKAEDLLALRQNKIGRDEARTRISERRY